MEPVLGWRIWNLRGGRLESWAVDYCWEPGENLAACLAPHRRACRSSPGLHCQCGFWAVWTPGQCLARACAAAEPPWHVMGLVVGWGTVALHGREGFRAERAALRCLFTDRPWSAAALPGTPSRIAGWTVNVPSCGTAALFSPRPLRKLFHRSRPQPPRRGLRESPRERGMRT